MEFMVDKQVLEHVFLSGTYFKFAVSSHVFSVGLLAFHWSRGTYKVNDRLIQLDTSLSCFLPTVRFNL